MLLERVYGEPSSLMEFITLTVLTKRNTRTRNKTSFLHLLSIFTSEPFFFGRVTLYSLTRSLYIFTYTLFGREYRIFILPN